MGKVKVNTIGSITQHTTHRGDGDGGAVSISRWSDTAGGSFGKVLHEEGAFVIRANTLMPSKFWSSKFPSVVEHLCSADEQARRRKVRKVWQGTWSAAKYEECKRCHVKIPDELLALWKLHNWDELIAWLGAQK